MNNAKTKSIEEFNLLEQIGGHTELLSFRKEITTLVEKFGQSGQSGGSAPIVANIISNTVKKLCLHETICPLTGEDDEWMDVKDHGGGSYYQNKRDSAVFKEGKDGKAYYLNAIIFDGDIGSTFTGGGVEIPSGGEVGSRHYIKEFPFTPKKFFIDVIDHRWADKDEKVEDLDGDWWTHTIKDENQLIDVFEYYNKFK